MLSVENIREISPIESMLTIGRRETAKAHRVARDDCNCLRMSAAGDRFFADHFFARGGLNEATLILCIRKLLW